MSQLKRFFFSILIKASLSFERRFAFFENENVVVVAATDDADVAVASRSRIAATRPSDRLSVPAVELDRSPLEGNVN